jgi:hypothetical protein
MGRGGRPYSGNAGEDGFTVLAKRPRSALAGNFVSEEEADRYDEMTDWLVEMGGRSAARRRLRDLHDDDYDDNY